MAKSADEVLLSGYNVPMSKNNHLIAPICGKQSV